MCSSSQPCSNDYKGKQQLQQNLKAQKQTECMHPVNWVHVHAACACMCVFSLFPLCVHVILCVEGGVWVYVWVCVCVSVWVYMHMYMIRCVCVCVYFTMLWMKMFINFCMFVYIPLICIYMGICALHGFVKFVKHFESPEVLYKFPIIIIIIIIIIIHSHSLVLDLAPRPLELAASWTSLSPAPWMVPRMLCSCRAQ